MANNSIMLAFERMWQHVVYALSNKSDLDHNHNDKYYTETEIDTKLSNKSDLDHTHTLKDIYSTNAPWEILSDSNKDAEDLFLNIDSELQNLSANKANESHVHKASDITSGTLSSDILPVVPVTKGGTGETSLNASANALVNSLNIGSTPPDDNTAVVIAGTSTAGTYYRKPMSSVWSYIKDKISSVLGLTETTYSGNAATATKATQDASGNVITSTYETKSASSAKLEEAKAYTDTAVSGIKNYQTIGFINHTNTLAGAPEDNINALTLSANYNNDGLNVISKDGLITFEPEEYGGNDLVYITVNADPIGSADAALDDAKEYVNTKTVNMATTSVVDTKISTHNTSTSAHNDIRTLISDLATEVSNFLDVDDATRNQLSEVLQLIDNNKGTLDSLTINKVNVSDIIDNLTTASANKVLSANQGVALKILIDTLESAFNTHTSNTTSHITSTERTNWNVAKTHADSAHAPVEAEPNQNAFTSIWYANEQHSAPEKQSSLEFIGISGIDVVVDDNGKNADISVSLRNTGVTGVKGGSESSYRTGQVNITKENIGLGNVDNTSDANKPVSTLQQVAINEALATAKSYSNTNLATAKTYSDNNLLTAKAYTDSKAITIQMITWGVDD